MMDMVWRRVARGMAWLLVPVVAVGAGVLGVAPAAAAGPGSAVVSVNQYAYITNAGAGTVSAVDTSTNRVVATITVGLYPRAVAVTPDGTKAFVATSNGGPSGTIHVIDTASNTVVRVIPNIGRDPYYLAVSPDGGKLYVALQNACSSTCPIQIVNTTTYAFPATPPIRINGTPNGMAITPAGLLYVAWNDFTFSTGYVAVVNAANAVVGNIPTGGRIAVGVRLSPDRSRVYVANQNSDEISYFPAGVVSPLPAASKFSLPVGTRPGFLTITPDGSTAYVTGTFLPRTNVTVVNLTTNPPSFRQNIAVGSNPMGANVSADGSRVYVSTSIGVCVIATATNTITARVSIANSGPTLGDFLANATVSVQPGRRPSATSWGSSRIDIAALSTAATIYDNTFDGTTWRRGGIGAPPPSFTLASAPAISTRGNGKLDVFAYDTTGRVWHRSFGSGVWQSWQAMPFGTFTGDPAAVSWNADRIDVVTLGTDGNIYVNWYNGTWHYGPMSSLGNPGVPLTGQPAVAAWAPGRLDIFAQDVHGRIWHRWLGPVSWSDWELMPFGTFTGGPAAVSWAPNRIDVATLGTDGNIYNNWFDGNSWHYGAQASLGNPGVQFASGPAISSWAPGRLDIFIHDTQGQLWHRWHEPGSWSNWETVTPT